MRRKLFRDEKGVSTVIGTILMIMVVMIGMSILFGALIVYSDNFHSGSGSGVLEAITVEDTHFIHPASGPNYVQLSLFNTGKTGLKISNVYINGEMATVSPTSLPIAEGGHQVLTITPPSDIQFNSGGFSYSFKIVTSRGTGFEGTYTW